MNFLLTLILLAQLAFAVPVPKLITRVHTASPVTTTVTYATATTTIWLPPVEILISDGVTYTITQSGGQWDTTQVYSTSTYSPAGQADTSTTDAVETAQSTSATAEATTKQAPTSTTEPTESSTSSAAITTADAESSTSSAADAITTTDSPSEVDFSTTTSVEQSTESVESETTPTTTSQAQTSSYETTQEATTEAETSQAETTSEQTTQSSSAAPTSTTLSTESSSAAPTSTTLSTESSSAAPTSTTSSTESSSAAPTSTTLSTESSSAAPTSTTLSTDSSSASSSSTGYISAPKYIVYSPYANDSSCKTYDEIKSDLELIQSKGINRVRIYSTDCATLTAVLPLCQSMGLRVNQGFWISSSGVDSIDTDVSNLVSWAETNGWDIFDFFTIGNEAINSGYCTVSELIDKISSVKSTLQDAGWTGNVTTAEPPATFVASPELCTDSEIDFVGINSHSYFNTNLYAYQAGEYVSSQQAEVAELCSKSASILETGYPHKGDTNGNNVPSRANQILALQSIMDYTGGDVTILTTYDDMWKDPGEYGIEQYFGMIQLVN